MGVLTLRAQAHGKPVQGMHAAKLLVFLHQKCTMQH